MTEDEELHHAIDALEMVIRNREAYTQKLRKDVASLRGSVPALQVPPQSQEWAGLGITEAAKLVLEETGPRATREIADAIRNRGVVTTSKRFPVTVYSTLRQNPSMFERQKDNGLWALTKPAKKRG